MKPKMCRCSRLFCKGTVDALPPVICSHPIPTIFVSSVGIFPLTMHMSLIFTGVSCIQLLALKSKRGSELLKMELAGSDLVDLGPNALTASLQTGLCASRFAKISVTAVRS